MSKYVAFTNSSPSL